ncbi:MAG TPA: EamA family transporter RarD [Segeticoccus sp.]|uniref:EamA family transporter RarD n=1 Tax=Segeticoccus sp. TaxID=2706531 RepID=UPI002D7FF015|nr:EamA family transporter RarD [Segeticoccus sp.]HET8601732.1 EamA family transporter RarD [Segeticoccus sp.]
MTPARFRDVDATRLGTAYGFTAYLIWGAFPLYFTILAPAGAWEILVHRILWSVVFCVLVVLATRDFAWVRPILRSPKALVGVTLASIFIAANWTIYVAAVMSGHVTEAALGYFLNPLVTVGLGVFVLRERLRPLQWAAVGIGLLGALYLTFAAGKPPWISLALACSFASYGFMKKRLGTSLGALHSLTAETAVLAPVAALVLAWLTVTGRATFTTDGVGHGLLLASSGVATAIPLLLFAAAARRVPLVTIGLLQFITPILQLVCGVVLLHEHLSTARWVGFAIVWLALGVLSADSLRSVRTRARRLEQSAEGAVA